ncbi:MAG: GTP 3',8-cyclase MoaA [bacterium]|nr:MAG: GTP 3',8-cyclase MoaA [bacterium]
MRVSVTDRCNLRCRYCTPAEEFVSLSHDHIITYEEIHRLAALLAPMGVTKVRITGGEPLVRKHLDRLVRSLATTAGITDISLTTNGYLLGPLAGTLRKAGLSRVNISLDSLKEDRFAWITGPNGEGGPGGLDRVLDGIRVAARAGLFPVKINAVLMRGFNDDELADFADLTRDQEYEVRFIEFMPMSPEGFWGPEKVVSAAEAIGRLETIHGPLAPLGRGKGAGPAVRYRIPGFRGTIGFITPVSQHFCIDCNRIRITADGKIRTCLFSDNETDLLTPLRSGAADDEILALIQDALTGKPQGHGMGKGEGVQGCARTMSHIGG